MSSNEKPRQEAQADPLAAMQRIGTNMEMAQAELRGWRDFLSGQPKDMPFTKPGEFAKNSQLNFAWTVGYESAQYSTLFTTMVGRADRSAERSQKLANEVAEQAAQICTLTDFAKDIADEGCFYGDNCPTFGTRHGTCRPCKARSVLAGVASPRRET